MTITAKFPGTCKKCGGSIEAGEQIEWAAGVGAAHLTCPEKAAAPAQAKGTTIEAGKLFKMFSVAQAHLKYPKVHIHNSSFPMFLYVAGEKSSTPGVLQIIRQDNKNWLGRVHPDGRVELSRGITDTLKGDLVKLLKEFAADPAGYATLHGIQTGACCFCGRFLEDYRSVSMGYGPICAEHYGMPWGEVDKEALKHNLEQIEKAAVNG